MQTNFRVLFVASEAVPFIKEGGLADVVGTLPKFLALNGHDVRLVIPRYYRMNKEALGLKALGIALEVPLGNIGSLWCGVYEGGISGTPVKVYCIEHERFFGRDSLYHQSGYEYHDNDIRFAFLSRASLELCQAVNFKPDIIHVHDWHTAVIPAFLNSIYQHDSFFSSTATLLTIHNMQHQGIFPKELMNILDIGWEHFNFRELEFYDRVNLLKAGITHATLLNTVSPTYAEEMKTAEFAYGLEGALNVRRHDLFSILNGVDYDEWNPETDSYIAAHYDIDDMSGKAACKKELQEIFNLPARKEVPVIGIVSRLVDQKGVDAVAEAIQRILSLDIQFIILGSGEEWAQEFFGNLPKDYPDKCAAFIGYNNPLAHKIEAGADFFLMPSRFEPCGLNQMFSLRYGTLPIVRATGGLNDTVENCNPEDGSGTGFKFHDLNAQALYNTIAWAISVYNTRRDLIQTMQKRGMAKRFSWQKASRQYEALYKLAVQKKRNL